MALDEPKEDDVREEVDGITFLIAKREERMVGAGRDIRVDHMNNAYGSGFYVSTTLSSSCGTPW